MKVHPYLNFDGQCEEAFNFYAKVLGGRIAAIMSATDSPMGEQLGPEWRGRTLHVHLEIGDQVILGSDGPPGQHQQPQGLWVSLQVPEVEEAERIFSALSDNGNVVMPLAPTFWAQRFGMTIDRYGTPWMVNCGSA